MAKIGDSLRRLLLPCFSPAAASSAPKKRLSTSLLSDLAPKTKIDDSDEETSPSGETPAAARASRSMVVGTIFGPRRGGHVWFCVQHDRSSARPTLLLELSIPTLQLVREMRRSGLVRIALECSSPELGACPLRSVPVWTLSLNGKKIGFAERRKPGERTRVMLRTMRSMTVAAGVIPQPPDTAAEGEVMYMRANYEHVVGNADSEAFHLINTDGCPGQELSVFLLRSR